MSGSEHSKGSPPAASAADSRRASRRPAPRPGRWASALQILLARANRAMEREPPTRKGT